MPISVPSGAPILFIRREAYERIGISRAALDDRLGLTPDEFRVEADLVAVGPLRGDETVADIVYELERAGLTYFDDFFELSGNWPEWLRLHAASAPRRD